MYAVQWLLSPNAVFLVKLPSKTTLNMLNNQYLKMLVIELSELLLCILEISILY